MFPLLLSRSIARASRPIATSARALISNLRALLERAEAVSRDVAGMLLGAAVKMLYAGRKA